MAWGEQVEQPLFHFLPLGENQGLVMAWNRGKKDLIKKSNILYFSKMQLAVYYQRYVLIG